MRIYLAGRYGSHPEMRRYRDQLAALGHRVTSRWIEGTHDERADALGLTDPVTRDRFYATEDIEDLMAADCSVHFTEDWTRPTPGRNRGGRHVELGVALMLASGCCGWTHRVIVVGHRENVFHSLPEVEFYPTWDECLAVLREEAEGAA